MKLLNCKQAREAIRWEAGKQGENPEGTPLRRHLDSCPDCRRLDAETRQAAEFLRQDHLPDPGPEFWNRMSTRIMAEVRRQEASPKPWYKKPWLSPLGWPVYAGAPALALLVLAVVWFARGPAPEPVLLNRDTVPRAEMVLDETLDSVVDPIYSLTPGQTKTLGRKVVAGLARDIRTRNESPVEAMVDWDLNNNLDGLTTEELEKMAKKLQTVSPTGNGEGVKHVT